MAKANTCAEKINEAGAIMLRLAATSEKGVKISRAVRQRMVDDALRLTEEAMDAQLSGTYFQKALVVHQAALALAETDAGGSALLARKSFHGAVEGLEGGPADFKLEVDGANARGAVQHDARYYYLRAALLVLWDKYKGRHKVLIKEANQILGLEPDKVGKRVGNNRRDIRSKSGRVEPHFALVRDIQEATGWVSLHDF